MQLVSDGVIMFDTMKDKKIGRAEVIEKFGVPPEKVIEVQALIGDSTDNVPGVPGIGVKTAAQLIGEYGDLETLLKRAPEIKQEKRRQSLIDNAEKARLSKKLVTLDDQVKLNVPIGELAVHEPDYKRLIAFLKAMEFNSLMRRVAEFSGADAGEIEPEARFAGHAASLSPPPVTDVRKPSGRKRARAPARRRNFPSAGRRSRRSCPQARAAKGRQILRSRRRLSRPRAWRPRAQPSSTAAKYETVRERRAARRLDRARARDRLGRARRCGREFRSDAGGAVRPLACGGAERSLLRAARPSAGRRGRRPVPRRCGARADCRDARRSMRCKPLLEDQGVLKIGHDLKFAWQMLALRGIEIAAYDDTMLMSYALDAGRARTTRSTSLAERTFNHAALDIDDADQGRQDQDHFRRRRHRSGD